MLEQEHAVVEWSTATEISGVARFLAAGGVIPRKAGIVHYHISPCRKG